MWGGMKDWTWEKIGIRLLLEGGKQEGKKKKDRSSGRDKDTGELYRKYQDRKRQEKLGTCDMEEKLQDRRTVW